MGIGMKKHSICVLGGTGFVGRHLVGTLTAAGHRIRVPARHRERNRELLVLPTVDVVETNIHDDAALASLLEGCDVVINLVAILNEARRTSFRDIHVELPRRIVKTCRQLGIKRLIHMSALNADAQQGASRYLQSKGEGEALVHAAADQEFHVTSFRPSIIFGPGDHFFNHFADLLKIAPVLPLPCPESRVAPVYVGDVAQAFLKTLDDKSSYGQRYELCGPRVYTLEEVVNYTARALKIKRNILPLSKGLSRLQAQVMQYLPGKPFTLDNYRSLQVDAVCQGAFPAQFNIVPTSVESVVPYYVGRRDQQAQYDAMRVQARHDY